MVKETQVARCRVRIGDESGLHLRPASEFVREAERFGSEVWIVHGGAWFDGKSILSLLSMGAGGGWVELEARGSDAREAIEVLSPLLGSGHDRGGEPGNAPPPRLR